MVKTNETPEFLEVWDVAKICHVERLTVYRWIKSGKLKGKRAGRKWLFTREDIEALLK